MVETPSGWMSFDLSVDRGLGELLGYVICGSVIAGLITLARRERAGLPLWAAAAYFAVVLTDDVVVGHEWLATALVETVATSSPVLDAAGRAAVLVAGSAVGVAGWWALRDTATSRSREVVDWIIGAVVVLGLVAVGLDVLQAAVGTGAPGLGAILAVIGEGGELAVIAAIASFVFGRVVEADGDDVDRDRLVIVDQGRIDLRTTSELAGG